MKVVLKSLYHYEMENMKIRNWILWYSILLTGCAPFIYVKSSNTYHRPEKFENVAVIVLSDERTKRPYEIMSNSLNDSLSHSMKTERKFYCCVDSVEKDPETMFFPGNSGASIIKTFFNTRFPKSLEEALNINANNFRKAAPLNVKLISNIFIDSNSVKPGHVILIFPIETEVGYGHSSSRTFAAGIYSTNTGKLIKECEVKIQFESYKDESDYTQVAQKMSEMLLAQILELNSKN